MQDATRVAADIPPQTQGDAGDFRTRSAARRRERMRLRLLEATMTVCAERDARAVVIDDVLRAADVSRATFYAHFESLNDAINIVGQTLIDEATSVYLVMYSGVTDVRIKAASGPQLFFTRSIIQPTWGSAVIQSYDFLAKSVFVRSIRDDIAGGMRSGVFRRGDLQAAVDLNLGALMQGVKTLRDRQRGRMTYIRSLTENLLMGLGVPAADAQEAVAWTREDLKTRGPQYLDWWKDIT